MSSDQDHPTTFTPDHSGTWEVEFTLTVRRNGRMIGNPTVWRSTVLGWTVLARGEEWPNLVEPVVVNDEGDIETIRDVRINVGAFPGGEPGVGLRWRLVRVRLAEGA